MDKKLTGSFYTPETLISYMISYVTKKMKPKKILEPSAGDGRFVSYLERFNASITLIEYDKKKVAALRKIYRNNCNIHEADFNKYALNKKEKYDLIVGNPPYISKKNIEEKMRKSSEDIIESFKLSNDLFQNIWVSFILSSIKLLQDNGSIFFVLPFEFLQVQYAERLRKYLEEKFNAIEIITFEDRIFDDIEQDICLVYLSNEKNMTPYIKYKTLNNPSSADEIFSSVIQRNKPLKKWSNCILNDIETEQLFSFSKKYKKVSSFGEISPGIVTGANNFFIVSNEIFCNMNLNSEYRLPIISKSKDVKECIIFKKNDYQKLLKKNANVVMINSNGIDCKLFVNEFIEYLKRGEKKELNKRYKCSIRNRWYDVPVIKKGDVSFFKRYNELPRLVVNEADVHTTDIAYNIRFFNEYDPKSFVFCFYNSLTLALCEYEGRFYGGGVGELVPTEFKALSIPYKKVNDVDIQQLDSFFRQKRNIDEIVDYVDAIVLKELDKENLQLLQDIRKKYLKRRLKKEKIHGN